MMGVRMPRARQVDTFVHVSHSEVIDRVVLQNGCDFGFAQSVRFGLDHAHGTGAFGQFGSQVGQVVDDGVQIDFQHGVVDAALHQGFDAARGERFGGFDQYRFVLEVKLGQVGQCVFQVVVEQRQFGEGVTVLFDLRTETQQVFELHPAKHSADLTEVTVRVLYPGEVEAQHGRDVRSPGLSFEKVQ